MRHLNNGTDHRHSKSCCDQSSPARRTMMARQYPVEFQKSAPGPVLRDFLLSGLLINHCCHGNPSFLSIHSKYISISSGESSPFWKVLEGSCRWLDTPNLNFTADKGIPFICLHLICFSKNKHVFVLYILDWYQWDAVWGMEFLMGDAWIKCHIISLAISNKVFLIENIKTTSMEDVRTRVLEKIKNI